MLGGLQEGAPRAGRPTRTPRPSAARRCAASVPRRAAPRSAAPLADAQDPLSLASRSACLHLPLARATIRSVHPALRQGPPKPKKKKAKKAAKKPKKKAKKPKAKKAKKAKTGRKPKKAAKKAKKPAKK